MRLKHYRDPTGLMRRPFHEPGGIWEPCPHRFPSKRCREQMWSSIVPQTFKRKRRLRTLLTLKERLGWLRCQDREVWRPSFLFRHNQPGPTPSQPTAERSMRPSRHYSLLTGSTSSFCGQDWWLVPAVLAYIIA